MPTILNRLDALKRPPVDGGPSLCLNMIVKDEAHVIRRCLASVKPLIKSWCIVDTGSTDGTQDIIREELSGIPGELHERPWIDFATARNQAKDLAQSLDFDYLMVIDADEVLRCNPIKVHMTAGVYQIDIKLGPRTHDRVWLVKKGYPGEWTGAIHEDLRQVGPWVKVCGPWIDSFSDGGRHGNHLNEDLKVLFSEIQKDPKNPRNYYYLAQTYMSAGDIDQAQKALELRTRMKGDPAELARARRLLVDLNIAHSFGGKTA